jgi:hypothetical protein
VKVEKEPENEKLPVLPSLPDMGHEADPPVLECKTVEEPPIKRE